jgi:hypothetical protein
MNIKSMVNSIKKEEKANTLSHEEKYEKGFNEIALELKKGVKTKEELKVLNAFLEKQPRSYSPENPDYFDYFKEINYYMEKSGAEKTRSLFKKVFDKSYKIKEELTREMNEGKIDSRGKYADMFHNPLTSKMNETLIVLGVIEGKAESEPYAKFLKNTGNKHAEEFLKKSKFKEIV